MPFDISTAQPAQESAGFDISSAQPIETEIPDSEEAVEAALALGGDTGEISEPQADPELLEYVQAVPEVAKTLVGGATLGTFGFAGGFVEGLFDELKSGEFGTQEAAKRIQQKAMQRATGFSSFFAPESEAGMQMVEGIAELTEDIPPLAPLLVEANVLATAARASAPLIATKLSSPTPLIDTKTGLPTKPLAKALNKKDVKYSLILEDPKTLPVVAGKSNVDDVVDTVIRKRIKQGSGNESLAGYKLDSKQKVVTDKAGVESVRQGFPPGDVASAKNTNQPTKRKMLEMLNIKRRIQGDSSVALEIRPSKLAGDELMNRFNFVRDRANTLRNELDDIARGEAALKGTLPGPGVRQGLKGLEIDTSSIESSVLTGLKKLNIDIPDDIMANTTLLKDYLKRKDAFVGSDISKDKTSQKLIKDTIDLLSEPGEADALRAHRIKRQIDTTVDFRKKVSGGLTDSGENFAKSVRRSLNDSIREVNPHYANVNDELSRALNSMNTFKDAMPRKVSFFADNIEEAVGQELRKLLSNYGKRQELRNSIKTLDDTSKHFGGEFDVDVNKLVQFNNTLDNRFGATARGSFKGEIESANIRSLRPTEILKDKASQAVIDSINQLRQIDDEKAFDSMQKLLKGE